MTDHEPPPATDVRDRRVHTRLPAEGPVQVRIVGGEIEGRIDNVSEAGVLFFSEGDVRVEVEYVREGESLHRTGTLVRVERMSPTNTGYAVEFD